LLALRSIGKRSTDPGMVDLFVHDVERRMHGATVRVRRR
jgi:hypothetical protein